MGLKYLLFYYFQLIKEQDSLVAIFSEDIDA